MTFSQTDLEPLDLPTACWLQYF